MWQKTDIAGLVEQLGWSWESQCESFLASLHTAEVKTSDWLESLRLPRDPVLAVQVALGEYGEFATREEIEELTPSRMRELVKIVVTKKEWERRLAMQTPATPAEPEKAQSSGKTPAS